MLDNLRFDGTNPYKKEKHPTEIAPVYSSDDEYKDMLEDNAKELDKLQELMYAHNRYGMLVIFQAMDAAGKDGTIKNVFSGVNPLGLKVYSFKAPTELELEHDFLWRTNIRLPERGSITIFNRSYYEEVLVVKVHPNILTESQFLPAERVENVEKVWKQRYKDISNFEKYLAHNGIKVVKFFLNVSKKEQAKRLIERLEDPSKNWKFSEGDIDEREYWDDYQRAFEDCINETSSKNCPWYVIPADDKKNMRLLVGQILTKELKDLKMSFPPADESRPAVLKRFIKRIEAQN